MRNATLRTEVAVMSTDLSRPRSSIARLAAAIGSARGLAFILAALCGVGAFAVNFHALSQIAATHGVPGHLAWIWALVVDLTIVAGTIAHLTQPRSVFVWALFLGAAAFSVAGNTIHGLQFGAVGVAVADFPPIALLALVHLCTRLTRAPEHSASPGADASGHGDGPGAAPDRTHETVDLPVAPWLVSGPAPSLTANWSDRFPRTTRASV